MAAAFGITLARLFFPFYLAQNLPASVHQNEFLMVQRKCSLSLLNV